MDQPPPLGHGNVVDVVIATYSCIFFLPPISSLAGRYHLVMESRDVARAMLSSLDRRSTPVSSLLSFAASAIKADVVKRLEVCVGVLQITGSDE